MARRTRATCVRRGRFTANAAMRSSTRWVRRFRGRAVGRPPPASTVGWLCPGALRPKAGSEGAGGEGGLVMRAEPFYPTRSGPPALRLSFGHLRTEEAREGVARFGRALSKLVSA